MKPNLQVNQKDQSRLGILFIVTAFAFVALIDTIVKILTKEINPVQVTWGFYLGFFLFLNAFAAYDLSILREALSTRHLVIHICRSMLLFGSLIALFSSLQFLPLADVTSIVFTAPIFVAILSGPFLQERTTWHGWIALLISLAGAMLILRPGGAYLGWATLLPVVSALCSAGFFIATRMLARRERDIVVLYLTACLGLIWATLLVPFFWTMPRIEQLMQFAIIGFLGALAHLLIIRAFARAPAPVLAPYMYVRLVWAIIFGYFAFGEAIAPQSMVGAALIIVSGLYVHQVEAGKQAT